MNRAMRSWLGICVVVAASMLGEANAWGQQPPTPGPEHAKLKLLEGTWDATVKQADGSESKGMATYKMTLGGLWLASEFTSDFGGVTFEGKGMDGYDVDKKKYVSVWFDSMTAAPMVFHGDYNKDGALVMEASGPGPEGPSTVYRSVTTEKNADHHVFQMFIGKSKEPMMTIEYRRKRS